MKKILFFLLIGLLLYTPAFCSDAERQLSHYEDTAGTTAIKVSAGTVFSVSMVATANAGFINLYDTTATDMGTIATLEPKVEIREATQYNSGNKEFSEGFKFYKGIVIYVSNATANVYYY